jgi:hypothetical protein
VKIQTFSNRRGLIHGKDAKRICCDKKGVLKIGNAEISITHEAETVMPPLFGGCTGHYNATFTDEFGINYDLGMVSILGGRLAPPSPEAVEIMELRCKLEEIEKLCETMRERISDLSNIFDTNSLNFLIK